MWDPSKDGVDHINIYSKGLTTLGQMMSNFSPYPISLPEGTFTSIEGYWYYLGAETGTRDILKHLYGYKAKQIGKEIKLQEHPMTTEEFENKIKHAIRVKVHTYRKLFGRLEDSTLPLAHYYVYGGRVVDAGFSWIVEYWELIRKELKAGTFSTSHL